MMVHKLPCTLALSVSLFWASVSPAQQPAARPIDFVSLDTRIPLSERDGADVRFACGLSASSLLPEVSPSFFSVHLVTQGSTFHGPEGSLKTFTTFKFTSSSAVPKTTVARLVRSASRVKFYVDTLTVVKGAVLDDLLFLLNHQVFPTSDRLWQSDERPARSSNAALTVLLTSIEVDEQHDRKRLTSYTWQGDLCRKSAVPGSNELSLTCIDVNLVNNGNAVEAAAAIAREYQRLVCWQHEPYDEEWVYAGLGSYLAFASGLGMPTNLSAFWQNPATSMSAWNNSPADYAASFLWTLYLVEQFEGDRFVQLAANEPRSGMAGFQAVLDVLSPGKMIQDVFVDWLLANFLDLESRSNETSRYGYYSFRNEERPACDAIDFLPSPVIRGSLPELASRYYRIAGGDDVVVRFAAEPGSGVSAKVVLLEHGRVVKVTSLPPGRTDGIIPVPGLEASDTHAVVLVYRFISGSDTGHHGTYELQVSGHGGPEAFSDSSHYYDDNSRTVRACSLPGRGFTEGLATAMAVRFTSRQSSRLVAAEFGFLEEPNISRRTENLLCTLSESTDLPGKVIAMAALESTRMDDGLVWRRYSFQNAVLLFQPDDDFHLVLSFGGIAGSESTIAVLDTARIPSDRSHVLVDSAGVSEWRSFRRGNNFFARAIFSVVADQATPVVEFEIVASRAVPGEFNVIISDAGDLDASSLEGTLVNLEESNSVHFYFQADSSWGLKSSPLKVPPGSQGFITVSGRHRFGAVAGADTLAVSAATCGLNGGCNARSADGAVEILMPPGSVQGAGALVVQRVARSGQAGRPPLGDFVETGLEFTLVTAQPHWDESAEVIFRYRDNARAEMAENSLVIAQIEQGRWTPIGGELYREQKVIRALVDSAATFGLLVRRLAPGLRDQLPSGGLVLRQNYPNPFNAGTTIRFSLSNAGLVTVRIVNLKGQVIAVLASHEFSAGDHFIEWDGTDDTKTQVASGVYLYQIESEHAVSTRKLVLVK